VDLIVVSLLQDEDGDLIDVDIEITRSEFEQMIRPLVDKTVHLTKKAIENARLTPDQIDYVILTGGSTQIPLVRKTLEDIFGTEKIRCHVHTEACVALGAAIMAVKLHGIYCPECGHVNDLDATVCEKCGQQTV
jgi:molecular chaperone DnaK